MENHGETLSQCRLCGLSGHHEIDIWDESAHNLEVAYSAQIRECTGVKVNRDDDSTKVCQQCFEMVNDYFQFRDSCSTKNVNYLLRKILPAIGGLNEAHAARVIENTIDESNPVYEISSEDESSSDGYDFSCENLTNNETESVMCITVTDTDSVDKESNSDANRSRTCRRNLSTKTV